MKSTLKLTEHFTVDELTVTDQQGFKTKNYVEGTKELYKLAKLASFCEKVREIIKCPMIITSGYRCEELNKAIGGSSTSQHIKFEAVDFIPKTISAENAFCCIALSNFPFGQLILEKRGLGHILHISMGNSRKTLYSANLGHYQQVKVIPTYK